MDIKEYDVTIYGRANTIILSIRGERIYSERVVAKNKKEAKEEAFNNFYRYMDDVWKSLINKNNVRIECEIVER